MNSSDQGNKQDMYSGNQGSGHEEPDDHAGLDENHVFSQEPWYSH